MNTKIFEIQENEKPLDNIRENYRAYKIAK